MAKHAIYKTDYTLVGVFTNKVLAVETMDNTPDALETRTYRHLTETQIKNLSYAEAIGMELTLRSNATDKKEQNV